MNEEKVFKAFDLGAIEKRSRSKASPRVPVNIRVSEAASKWLKEKGYSPTGLFNETMRVLGFVEPVRVVDVEVKPVEEPAPVEATPEGDAAQEAGPKEGNIEAGPTDKERANGDYEDSTEPHPQSYEANNEEGKEEGEPEAEAQNG